MAAQDGRLRRRDPGRRRRAAPRRARSPSSSPRSARAATPTSRSARASSGERRYRPTLARRIGIARLRARRLGDLRARAHGHDVRLPRRQPPRDRALRRRLPARLSRGRGGRSSRTAPGCGSSRCPVADARAPGRAARRSRPLRSVYYMLKVLHGGGDADAAPARQAPGGALTRVTLVSLLVADRAPARRARARAAPAPAGALLSALAGDRPGASLVLAAWPGLLDRHRHRARASSTRPTRSSSSPSASSSPCCCTSRLVISRLSEQTSRLAQRLAMLEEQCGASNAVRSDARAAVSSCGAGRRADGGERPRQHRRGRAALSPVPACGRPIGRVGWLLRRLLGLPADRPALARAAHRRAGLGAGRG